VAAAARTLVRPVKNRFMLSAYLLINMSSGSVRVVMAGTCSRPGPAGSAPAPPAMAGPEGAGRIGRRYFYFRKLYRYKSFLR